MCLNTSSCFLTEFGEKTQAGALTWLLYSEANDNVTVLLPAKNHADLLI